MLKIVEYLRGGNSLDSLKKEPYCLKIQEVDNFVLLKYDQINSDLGLQLVRECRGIILERDTWTPVCFPFTKFFNIDEPHAAKLNGRIHVYQKVDGSLCKVWNYNGEWHLSSNGSIDAAATEFNSNINFFELFKRCLKEYNLTWEQFTINLDPSYTYMYEMATQDNRVVIPYQGYHLYYLGQRNIHTYQEEYVPTTQVENVKVYSFEKVEDVMAAAKELPNDEEGYVVRDDNWNRVKVKNPTYFMLHNLAMNGSPNFLKYYVENEMDEFLSYFPEYKGEFKEIERKMNWIASQADVCHLMLLELDGYSLERKDFAAKINEVAPDYFRPFLFKTYSNSDYTWHDFVSNFTYHDWEKLFKKVFKNE